MVGPCTCGDLYCPSCGSAQGNHRCPICGYYSADGGCPNPEQCEAEMTRMEQESLEPSCDEYDRLEDYNQPGFDFGSEG